MADPGVYRDEDFAAVPYLRTALSIASDSYPFPNVPEGDLIWDATSGAAETALSGTPSRPARPSADMQDRLSAGYPGDEAMKNRPFIAAAVVPTLHARHAAVDHPDPL